MGGPPLYTEAYGHPCYAHGICRFRLAMPSAINGWSCMLRAMQDVGIEARLQKELGAGVRQDDRSSAE